MKRILFCLAALTFGALQGQPASAETAAVTPTPEQIEAFEQLPPEQQQHLLERFRGLSPSTVQEQPVEQPETVVPTEPAQAEPRAAKDPETGLPLFGYDVFSGVPTTFAPVTDIPVPVDYVLGPGDVVKVQLFGKEPGDYALAVNRDGAITFPQLGPITVAGLPFDELRQLIQARVAEQMIGTNANVTLGELRSIRIFVLGDVNRPGAYTVSSLSTITNALLSSGGISTRGTLRNIQLKRSGQVVTTIDLYDLLLRGDTSADARLDPGDVIFVPPVGARAGVDGQVPRVAIYELKGESTVGELVQLAGGFEPTAYPQGSKLSRVNAYRERIQQDLDLRMPEHQGLQIRDGDLLTVPSILDRVENVVTLEGHVMRPGRVEYRPGIRLTDVISSIESLQPMADLNYVLIRREAPPNRRVVALSADLEAAFANRRGPEDPVLMPRDQIRVFDIGTTRPDLEQLLGELRQQADLDNAAPVVRVGGRVRAPGTYPLEAGMRVSDLLRAGGALAENAYAIAAEVTRYQTVNGEQRQIGLIDVDLAAIRRGDASADLVLQSYDFLNVREVSDWAEHQTVELRGEVRFPGSYPIRRGETLLAVLERAGGLTEHAFPEGAIFTRVELRQREEQQIRSLIQRMEADVAALSLQQAQEPEIRIGSGSRGVSSEGPESSMALMTGRGLLNELRNATPVGRLAMDFPALLRAEPGSAADIVLENGDVLMVPGPMQSVTVIGEVQSPTSLLYEPDKTRDDYINMSGGLTRRADPGRIYVVKANGQVEARGTRRWFRQSAGTLSPGDTVVVPADLERVRPIPLWTSVTSIIFNLAVAVAAVNSF